MGSSTRYRGVSALALLPALLCLGIFATGAAAQPYTINEELSLTGDCSTSEADEAHDPDCTGVPPAYPPSEGPSGRFSRPFSVAVDEWGNLYVASRAVSTLEGRIDIFDSEGHFISELADPNGPASIAVDSKGNLYAYERTGVVSGKREVVRYPPDVYNPAAGEISYDPGDRTEIFTHSSVFTGLEVDRSNDRLFVAKEGEIREYGSASEGNPLIATIGPAGLVNATYVAIDAQRRLLYTQSCKEPPEKCVVWAFNADTHTFIKEIDGSNTPAGKFISKQGLLSLAVDETNGHLFVGDLSATSDIYEFDAEDEYSLVSSFKIPGGNLSTQVQSAVANNPKDPDPENLNPADNYRHLFVPLSHVSGSAIAFKPPEVTAPVVNGAAAVGIGSTEAELEAQVNPKQAETTYQIQYVTEAQFAIDEWESALLADSGTLAASNKLQRVSAPALGLLPGTAYRFRIIAENEAGEGEDVGAFATYDDAPLTPPGLCPNGLLLTGPSATLPDCRAYELVTAADTNGGRPGGAGFEGDRFSMVQARPDGSGVSFELASGALPGTEATGGFHGDPYLATRTSSGWSAALAGPTGTQSTKPQPGSISPDQGHVFWIAEGTGTAVIPGVGAHYIRYPDGTSELVGRGSLGTDPWAVGRLITENAGHIVFETRSVSSDPAQKLEPNAPSEGTPAVYDRTADEVTHVVSLLPGNITPTDPATYTGASPDGGGIAFRVPGSPSDPNVGTLYLRVGNKTTYEIADPGVPFAGIAEGGKRIFYLEEGDLKARDVEEGKVIDFTEVGDAVPVNISPQGNRAYFVSETAVAGSGPNQAGDEPQAGEQNLYLSEGEGTPSFIATVTERDVEGIPAGTGVELDGLGLWVQGLEERRVSIDPSRTSSDGGVLVFQSRAELAEYDSGEDPQIYRYEATSGELACLSCPPTKTAPSGGALLQSIASNNPAAPLSPYGFVPNLAKDGERIFFESTEALVSADTNAARDVYEWEEDGIGSCDRAGGCVYLISAGRGDNDSYLFGHSQSGDDVFFTTNDILVAGDEATRSIYDAKVGGGFAQAESPACEGEECRPLITPPPALPVVKSDVLGSSANVEPGKRRCPRGKRAVKRKGGKVVCVKKHKKRRGARKPK